MAWVILVLAGLFEVGWAIGLKYTEGFSRFWPTLWTVLAIIASLWLLGIAMKSLPVGTAYAVGLPSALSAQHYWALSCLASQRTQGGY